MAIFFKRDQKEDILRTYLQLVYYRTNECVSSKEL